MKKKLFNFMLGDSVKDRIKIITERRGQTIAGFVNEAILLQVEEWERRMALTDKITKEGFDRSTL